MDLSQLEGIPYVEGRDDCYGLIRRYVREVYDLHLTNYARPVDFAYTGLDLLNRYFKDEGFKIVETSLSRLHKGDLLLMQIGRRCPTANHIAAYTGSSILHHLVDAVSVNEPFTMKWRQRVITVIRHPEITEANAETLEVINFDELIPDHVKFKYEQ